MCRETIRTFLKRLGFSWKKAKKLLNRADPGKRQAFLKRLEQLPAEASRDKATLVFVDEAHVHQDVSPGYGWAPGTSRFWVASSSPSLAEKVTFYGTYLYNSGQVRLYDYDKGDTGNTLDFLERVRRDVSGTAIKLIWDGASYHRPKAVYHKAGSLGIELVPLPGDSPDFMPVEELWRWLREEVTALHCHETRQDLVLHVRQFETEINSNPYEVADRLWRSWTLDPEIEKLRLSN